MPLWSPSGDVLYYRDGNRQWVAARLALGTSLTVTERDVLFDASGYELGVGKVRHDITLDGERFIFIRSDETPADPGRFVLVQNFFEELKEKVARE